MSRLEQLDFRSASGAADEAVEPRIARALAQGSAPFARDEAPGAHEVPPTAPPVRASATSPPEPPAGERAGQRRRRRLRMLLSIGGVLVVAAAAGVIWLRGGRFVSTGDAYIQAARLMVSTDVSGIVTRSTSMKTSSSRRAMFCSGSIPGSSRSRSTMPRPTLPRRR